MAFVKYLSEFVLICMIFIVVRFTKYIAVLLLFLYNS